jgi:hypothetical protein
LKSVGYVQQNRVRKFLFERVDQTAAFHRLFKIAILTGNVRKWREPAASSYFERPLSVELQRRAGVEFHAITK